MSIAPEPTKHQRPTSLVDSSLQSEVRSVPNIDLMKSQEKKLLKLKSYDEILVSTKFTSSSHKLSTKSENQQPFGNNSEQDDYSPMRESGDLNSQRALKGILKQISITKTRKFMRKEQRTSPTELKPRIAFKEEIAETIVIENWKEYNGDMQVEPSCRCNIF